MDKCHQVHTFVICFVEQFVDPAMVITYMTKGAQVLQQSADHAGYRRNGFQDNGAVAISACKEFIGNEPQRFDKYQGNTIPKSFRGEMIFGRCYIA